MIAVLGEVVEKPLRNEFNEINASQPLGEKPFPLVERLNLKELNSFSDPTKSEKKPNKSLFAQNLERQGKLKSFLPLNQVHLEKQEKLKEFMNKNNVVKEECVNKQIISGEGLGSKKEVEQIHLENLEILSKLKPDEVLKEQQKTLFFLVIDRFIDLISNHLTNTEKMEDSGSKYWLKWINDRVEDILLTVSK